jgi:hypothetical protein
MTLPLCSHASVVDMHQRIRDVCEDIYTLEHLKRRFFSPYAIENWFSQLKHYLKADGVLSFSDLKRVLRVAMARISPENYRNYFLFAYRKQELRKRRRQKSTRSVSQKTYKLK